MRSLFIHHIKVKVLELELEHHSLKTLWGTEYTLQYAFRRLVVCLDSDLVSLDVLLKSFCPKYYSEHLFFYLGVLLLCFCEGP